MIIKFTRKEALKLFKWRTRRAIKKSEKHKNKDPAYKEIFDAFASIIDNNLAFGIGFDEDEKGNDTIDHVSIIQGDKNED